MSSSRTAASREADQGTMMMRSLEAILACLWRILTISKPRVLGSVSY